MLRYLHFSIRRHQMQTTLALNKNRRDSFTQVRARTPTTISHANPKKKRREMRTKNKNTQSQSCTPHEEPVKSRNSTIGPPPCPHTPHTLTNRNALSPTTATLTSTSSLGAMREISLVPPLVPQPPLDPVLLPHLCVRVLDDALLRTADHLIEENAKQRQTGQKSAPHRQQPR